jgi:hypothetical protein
MGCKVKVQKVVRPATTSYYINLPLVMAETLGIGKGEELEWSMEGMDKLVLKRKEGAGKAAGKSGAKLEKKTKAG